MANSEKTMLVPAPAAYKSRYSSANSAAAPPRHKSARPYFGRWNSSTKTIAAASAHSARAACGPLASVNSPKDRKKAANQAGPAQNRRRDSPANNARKAAKNTTAVAWALMLVVRWRSSVLPNRPSPLGQAFHSEAHWNPNSSTGSAAAFLACP